MNEQVKEKYRFILRYSSLFKEKETRLLKIAEYLSSLSAEESAYILNELIENALKGEVEAQKSLACIIEPRFNTLLGEGKIILIYNFALENGLKNVERLFKKYKNKEMPAGDGDNPYIPELENMTLGEKKFKARTGDFSILDKFAHDLTPPVIENLLKNPRITERVVLKIASRRPSNPAVLEVISKNEKWISRYRVKKALVLNPYTPVNIALGLVNFLLKQDLEEILESTDVHPEVRKAVLEALKKVKGYRKKIEDSL